MRKFIKPELLETAKTPSKLASIDFKNAETHVSYKKVDIGFLHQRALNNVKGRSDRDTMSFRM